MRRQIGLEQRLLAGVRRAEPDQPGAPAFGGVGADVLALRQLRQHAHAVGAPVFVADQVFGQGQLDIRIAGHLAREPLQAGDGARQALVGIAEEAVVLERDLALRLAPLQGLVVGLHRLVDLARGRQHAGAVQVGRGGAAGQADILLQALGEGAVGVELLEPGQVALGVVQALLAHRRQPQAVHRLLLRRIGQQQFLPGLRGALGVALVLPVASLLQQRSGGGRLRPATLVHQGGQNADGQLVAVQGHFFSHSNDTRPVAPNR